MFGTSKGKKGVLKAHGGVNILDAPIVYVSSEVISTRARSSYRIRENFYSRLGVAGSSPRLLEGNNF